MRSHPMTMSRSANCQTRWRRSLCTWLPLQVVAVVAFSSPWPPTDVRLTLETETSLKVHHDNVDNVSAPWPFLDSLTTRCSSGNSTTHSELPSLQQCKAVRQHPWYTPDAQRNGENAAARVSNGSGFVFDVLQNVALEIIQPLNTASTNATSTMANATTSTATTCTAASATTTTTSTIALVSAATATVSKSTTSATTTVATAKYAQRLFDDAYMYSKYLPQRQVRTPRASHTAAAAQKTLDVHAPQVPSATAGSRQ